MKFFRSTVPNLTVSLSVAVIVIVVLDYYNPMMGFLHSGAARVLVLVTAIFSLIASLSSYIAWRREKRAAGQKMRHIKATAEQDWRGE